MITGLFHHSLQVPGPNRRNPATAAILSRIASCIAAGARPGGKKVSRPFKSSVKGSRNRPSPFRPETVAPATAGSFSKGTVAPGLARTDHHDLCWVFFEKWRE
jgi:hypothetical protein